MAYIEPIVATDLANLAANPFIQGSSLNFRTRAFLKAARQIVGPADGAAPAFAYLPAWQQLGIINKATALATS